MVTHTEQVAALERLTPERRLEVIADFWPELPDSAQVAIVGLVWVFVNAVRARTDAQPRKEQGG